MDLDCDNRKSPQQIMFGIGVKLAVILFIFLMVATECSHKENAKKTNEKISNIDDEIANSKRYIDSLRTTKEERIHDSLMTYPDYQYISQNQHTTDSLRAINKQLLDSAYKHARSNSLTRAVYRNENLFSDFSDMMLINKLRTQYYKNKRTIDAFDNHCRTLGTIPHDIRRHIDSATYAQISQYQNQIDSLLNEKNNLISCKQK